MVQITYRDEVIWGTSLGMANEIDIKKCYNYIKEHIKSQNEVYNICKHSQMTKNFIDMRYDCGDVVRVGDLCDNQASINREDLIKEIEGMVASGELNVNGENVLDAFERNKYIEVYACNRVFFIK